MPEDLAEHYREQAKQARAKAATTASPEFRRQWLEIAAHYDVLATGTEKMRQIRK
jgi:hypothetical protein